METQTLAPHVKSSQKFSGAGSCPFTGRTADSDSGPASGLVHAADQAIDFSSPVHDQLREFIFENGHPCVGAAAALNKDQYWLGVYSKMGDLGESTSLARDLNRYLQAQQESPKDFATFIAVFKDSQISDEEEFEKALWTQLSQLDRISSVFHGWDPSVSADPQSKQFSFSFGGKAFYVVGLHPQSSRMARAFPHPTLVFNLHSQFEALRQSGKYERMRNTIRSRDEKLQGSTNPMMNDFGSASEARQYSGRQVDANWKCPFQSLAQPLATKN
jgi:FPC/CPF motif-containing protein YcgG